MANQRQKLAAAGRLFEVAAEPPPLNHNGEARAPTGASGNAGEDLSMYETEFRLQSDELRAARLALEAERDRYMELFDFAPVGYTALGEDGTVRQLNHAASALLDEPRSRLVGKRFRRFVVPSDRAVFDELFARVLRSETKESCELRLLGGIDEPRVVRVTAVTLTRAEPTVLVALENITAQKRAEAELRQADRALREANRKKDELLAVLSRELRAPVSTILINGELLGGAELDAPRPRMAVDAIRRAARIEARLIEELLDVSHTGAGNLSMQVEDVNLADLARAAMTTVSKEAELKSIAIEADFEATVAVVSGDAGRLQKVFENLLNNAVKFTPQGGRIRITLDIDGAHALFHVKDSGVGIAPDFLPHVFERFSQGDLCNTGTTGGLGLGLSIAQSIVLAHCGRLQARSAGPGKGAVFTVVLPLAERVAGLTTDCAQPERYSNSERKSGSRKSLLGAK